MADFSGSLATADEILKKAKHVGKTDTLESAGIDLKWLAAYGKIARRCRDDKDFGISRYPYEQGPSVGAFQGGFFEHKQWPIRKAMEKFSSLRSLAEYEANYMNAAGYWAAFYQTAISLREEVLQQPEAAKEDAVLYDVWAIISIRYVLRVVGLLVEFYVQSANDPNFAKLLMPVLEKKNRMAATDDLDETVEKLDSLMAAQLMKAVANLSATNELKRKGGVKDKDATAAKS